MKKIVITTLFVLCALITRAQGVDVKCHINAPQNSSLHNLLPKPHFAQANEGVFNGPLDNPVINIVTDEELGTFNYTLEGFPNEGYKLTVATDGISITAASQVGVIRAKQTLQQLVASDGSVECCQITDFPAFKIRGFMHDVGRSFISFDELKKEIDLLSRFKVNVFHWHLTDNQGFRFESKKYPQLNAPSSFSRFAGQYYTQEECKQLEAYAHERGITIIPEIDMPGHSRCFTTAMGFSMSSTEGRAVLKDLLSELGEAFPLAPYIHMGADEAGTTAEFVNEMSGYIKQTLKRRVVVWNKISGVNITTQNLPYVDMTWMWATSGSKVSGMANVDCRYNYTNHFDVFADVVGIYKSNVYYAQHGSPEVAGALTAIWNDRKSPNERDIIAQNNLYANALATCERAWIGGGNQYVEQGGVTLPNYGDEYDEFADWERRFLFYKDKWLSHEPIPYIKQTNVRWLITDSATFSTQATGAGIYLRHTWGGTVPALIKNPQLGTTAHATTFVYSPIDQTVGAQIEFHNYGRSENDYAPPAGQWDRKGSRIFLNDEEIMPPVWANTGRGINSETDLANENFTMRQPTVVTLRKGWNKVYIKLPYVNASNIRLNKWMFTFVLCDLDGQNALDNVVYSPHKLLSEDAEQAWAIITDIEQEAASLVKDAPGYYPTSLTEPLMSTLDSVKAVLATESPDITQITELVTEKFLSFQSSLATAQITMPKASTDDSIHWYTLQTPLREGLYLSAEAPDAVVTGVATPSASSQWRLVLRPDNTYDIINANGGYADITASYNSPIRLIPTQPSRGWSLQLADECGYFIIHSNSVQFNQTTKGSHSAQLFNWGNGNNTTDVGCKFVLCEVEDMGEPVDPIFEYLGVEPDKKYTITNVQRNGTRHLLYADNGQLTVAAPELSLTDLGAYACFVVEGHEGRVAFKNVQTDQYLVWKGKGGGTNSDSGFLSAYNPTFCNWTIKPSTNLEGGYWFYSKRGNGTTEGSLVIMSATSAFDAFSDAEGWHSNYSNVYQFTEVSPDDPNHVESAVNPSPTSGQAYDLSGRPLPNGAPLCGIYIQGGRKVVKP